MFVRQLVNFVMVQQDDGNQILLKYMLLHQDTNKFGILIEKHSIYNGNMSLMEECESDKQYTLTEALRLAELCTKCRVLPSTYLEIENELHKATT